MALDIRMTPEELRAAAGGLDQERETILDSVRNVEKIIEETTANWSGNAQSAFVEGFDSMRSVLKEEFPRVLEGLAQQLKGAADTLERADEELANALKN